MVMQPYIFPYLGYFQLIQSVDRFVLYDDVNYIKGGWVNRNFIQRGGVKHLFTISLEKASPNKKINQILIKDTFKRFLNTIRHFYSKAPFFGSVFPLLEDIAGYNDRNLARFAGNSIILLCSYAGIETEILYSSEIREEKLLSGKERLINICKILGASVYINSIGGERLYDRDDFKNNGIELIFLKPDSDRNCHDQTGIVTHLSIIDVLMYNSQSQIKTLLNQFSLV
jgi:hypothetical protein